MAQIVGEVLEQWTRRPVPRAVVIVQESGVVVTADGSAKFHLANIEQGYAHLIGSADEYTSNTARVKIEDESAEYHTTIYLKPVMRALK